MAKKKKKQILFNHEKSTWENTAKEQPYLMPGTAEYEERCEDLQEHDPFRPDDVWHEKEEEENAEHAEELRVQNGRQSVSEVQRKYLRYMSKEMQAKAAKSAVLAAVEATETLDDDRRAKRALPKELEALEHDDSVTEDDYLPKALRKYQ